MHRKALLGLSIFLVAAAAGCRNTVAPREDSGIGGTLSTGHDRNPVPGVLKDGVASDSTSRIGGTLSSGH